MNFMKQDMDDFGDKNTGSYGSMRSFQNSSQTILPGLEKMCKMFIENHQRIENMLGGGSHHLSSPTKYG
jgi:hypothetical protein